MDAGKKPKNPQPSKPTAHKTIKLSKRPETAHRARFRIAKKNKTIVILKVRIC